jgi:hypothetical protein
MRFAYAEKSPYRHAGRATFLAMHQSSVRQAVEREQRPTTEKHWLLNTETRA